MRIFLISILIFLMGLNWSSANGQETTLVSGKAIKSNIDNGYGRFALPSINGFVMGVAHVDEDDFPDLFLQSDRWNPGTYLYRFKEYNDKNEPVFFNGEKITIPFDEEIRNRAIILENDKNEIFGFWGFGDFINFARFNKETFSFSKLKTVKIKSLPRNFQNFGVVQLAESKYLLLFSVADSTYKRYSGRGPNVKTYGPEGFWQHPIAKSGIYGAFVSNFDDTEIEAKPLTSLTQAYFSIEGYSLYETNNEQYLLCGTRLGNIHAYQIDAENEKITDAGYIVDSDGVTMRNPIIHGTLAFFEGVQTNGLIVSGEGGIYFYKTNDSSTNEGRLIFENPSHLLQSNADLYGSSLVVPNLVDWDGDGDLDIVSGTSLGVIHFFQNVGSNLNPKFEMPERIKAGGYEIFIQPGYNQDIQGPGESRWGYSCPIVADWTGNGLPDILTGDSRGKFNVYVNTGTKTQAHLEPEHPLFLDGMDMHGTWRVRPGVGNLGSKMAYICLDTDDEFHLYWQLDKYNLEDGKKLTLSDGTNIRANFLNAGATGRAKILIVDWDQDGTKDLLVGTPRHGSIPEPLKGLPYHLKKNGSSVLFLRNTGTEENPVFEYPKMLEFKGEPIILGQHSCAPTTGFLGPGQSLNLIVGEETGRFIFFERKDLE